MTRIFSGVDTPDTYFFANGIRVNRAHLLPMQLERYAEGPNLHEPVEEAAILRALSNIPPGPMIFVDLGASIGYYCFLVARHRPEAVLHAYEPDLDNHPKIQENAAYNNSPKIHLHPEAVGDKVGQGLLAGAGFIGHLARAPGAQGRTVPVTTIDAIADQLGTIHLLKMDIQGGEVYAMQGAENALRNRAVRLMILGTHHEALHSRCLEILRAHSYTVLFESMWVEHQPDGLIVAAAPDAPAA